MGFVPHPNPPGSTTASYRYDHAGRRIQKTENGVTTNYLYDGDAIHAEYPPTSWAAPASVYVQAGADRPLARLTGATNLPTATAAYYHADGQGSVLATSNASKAVTATQRFDAYGVKLAGVGTVPVYGYTGREPDATGLVYYRARYYDPALGRFASRDPIGLAGGINRYAYVSGNPVNLNDPDGLAARAVSNLWDARQSYYNFMADPQTALGVAEGAAGTFIYGGSAGGGLAFALPSGGTVAIPASAGMAIGSGLILDAGRRLANSATQHIYNSEASGNTNGANTPATTQPNDVVPYRPTNSGLQNHHGVMDAWAKANIPGYVSRASNAPTVALTPEQHAATMRVYNNWIKANPGAKVSQMSAQNAQSLSKQMFDSANVPSNSQQQYFRAFQQYIYEGKWKVGN